MTEREFDKLIEKTLAEHGDELFAEPTAPEHRFSPEFDSRVMAAAKGKKKKKGQLLRIITGIGAAAAVLVIGVVAVSMLGKGFGNIPVAQHNTAATNQSPSETSTIMNEGAATDDIKQFSGETSAESKDYPGTENIKGYSGNKSTEITNNAAKPAYPETDAVDEPLGETPAMEEPSGQELERDEPSMSEPGGTAPGEIPSGTTTDPGIAEEPDSTATSSESVTVIRTGELLILDPQQTEQLVAMANEMVSDSNRLVKTVFSEDLIGRYTKEGYFITVRTQNGGVAVDTGEGIKYITSITLLISDNASYAIAEGEDLYLCYYVPDASEVTQMLDRIDRSN